MKPLYPVAAAAAVLAFAGAANAAEVEIRNAVARVVVIPEDRTDIAVEIDPGSAGLDQPRITRRGSDVIIDGGLARNAIQRCSRGAAEAVQPGDGARVQVRGLGQVNVNEAPLIVVRTPRDVEVRAGASGGRVLGLGGSNGAVYGAIGRGASSIELSNRGCGDWTVANTPGELDINNSGSGQIRAGTSGELDLSVAGSGDVRAGATGDADISVAGSGDVYVTSARSADIAIAGSGDVRVGGGQVQRVDVSIAGSGGVVFNGRAGDVSASIMGSGDVRIDEATGSVNRRVMGSGEVRIGR